MESSNFNCQKCSKRYCIITVRPLKGVVPLSLPCKHTMCDVCIKTKLKLNEQLKCDLCDHNVELTPEESKELLTEDKFYETFPINLFILGQLLLELSQISLKPEPQNKSNPYIDIKSIIKKSGSFQNCSECKAQTCHKCVTCGQVYCDKCFVKIHSAFESLKSHTKEKIGFEKKATSCQAHPSVEADFYCDTCKKPICMSCLVIGQKECSEHNINRFHDKNISNIEKFKEVQKQADELFRRLTKTAVDIGNKLDSVYNCEDSNSETDELHNSIRQHYAKLHACLQRNERDKLQAVRCMRDADVLSLEHARTQLEASVAAVENIRNNIAFYIDNIDIKVNITELVDQMEETIMNTGWFLQKLENTDDTPTLKFDADIFKLLEEHLSVNVETHRGYTLLPTKDVSDPPPAPPKPVFPPEIKIVDVRMKDKKADAVTAMVSPPAPFSPSTPFTPPTTKVKENSHGKVKRSSDYVPPPRGLNPYMVPTNRSYTNSMSSLNSNDSESYKNMYNSKNHNEDFSPDLKEGTTEIVYVEHINDPSNFFVIRVSLQKKARELKQEIGSANAFQRPSQVVEGNLYLGMSKLNNKLQRCKVLSVSRDNSNMLYEVFYIDHGHTDRLTHSELRTLPLNLTLMPALALHCQLHNVRPTGPAWHPDDIKLMYRIINNKKVMLHVQGVISTALGQSVQCDMTTLEDKVDVARALVFHDQARFLQPDYNLEMQVDLPKLIYNPDLKKNQVEEVVITCIVSPDKFYVRKYYMEGQYLKLSENLQEMYGDIRRNHQGKVYCPLVGMVVAVHVNLDSEDTRKNRARWHRAVVVAPASKSKVLVSLPDSGHEATVQWNQLRKLHSRMFEIKALAVECHLSYISPVNKKWSEASVRALAHYSQQKIKMVVDDVSGKRSSIGVRLYDDSDQDNEVCINELFVNNKYAVNIGALTFALPKPKPIQDKAPVPKKKVLKPKPEVEILQREPVISQNRKDNLDVTVDRGNAKLEVKILSCLSPSQLYVTLNHSQEELTQLYRELHEYYEKSPAPEKTNWNVNDKCCLLDMKDNMWKRATILQIDGASARVFYTDFATLDEVSLDRLSPLAPEFNRGPVGAIKCHLRGIAPAGAADWPRITCERLTELLEDYTRYFITKKGCVRDMSMPVELWVYHVTPGSALEPCRPEWKLINEELVQLGLALPDRDPNDAAPDDTLSLLAAPDTVSGTVDQWLRLKPNTERPLPEPTRASPPPSPKPEPKKRPRAALKNWLPPAPLDVGELECTPTFVDNDGVIYLHDVNSEDYLDLIGISLNARYNNSPAEDTAWETGDPCVAIYSLDDQFYRGRITKVFDSASYAVEFVDYGNVEVCAADALRRELLMLDVPVLALRCRLADIVLIGGKRRLEAAEYVHRIIVDKRCRAKILAKEGDLYVIELYLKGQCLNKLLVDTQFATPTCSLVSAARDLSLDSDPDFILEEDSSTSANISENQLRDWSKVMEEEAGESLAYEYLPVSTDAQGLFKCIVEYINDVTTMHLLLSERDPDDIARLARITEEIQREGADRPPVSDLYPNKPCISLFKDDNIWYRASILKHDPINDKLQLSYVDFGNSSVEDASRARETRAEWVRAPPRLLRVRLHRVRQSAGATIADISEAYTRLLMSGELVARLINRIGDTAVVELRREPDGPLAYQEMLDEGLIEMID